MNDDVLRMVQAKLSPAIVISTISSAPSVNFDLSPSGVIVLKNSGVQEAVIQAMITREKEMLRSPNPDAPERSERLSSSRDADFILRNFKTLWVNATQAKFFGSTEMKAALAEDKDFQTLGVVLVDDPKVADVVLDVAYTFAWDYPFTLKHQNSTMVLTQERYRPLLGSVGSEERCRGTGQVAKDLSSAGYKEGLTLHLFNSAYIASDCWNCRHPAVGGVSGQPVARQP
jgi:hypothetical protein